MSNESFTQQGFKMIGLSCRPTMFTPSLSLSTLNHWGGFCNGFFSIDTLGSQALCVEPEIASRTLFFVDTPIIWQGDAVETHKVRGSIWCPAAAAQ